MLKNKQKLSLDSNIKDVFEKTEETTLFLFISLYPKIEKNNVHDVLKIPNMEFNKEFQDLLGFILPFGVKITGCVYFISNKSDISKLDTSNLSLNEKENLLERSKLETKSENENYQELIETVMNGIADVKNQENKDYLVNDRIFSLILEEHDISKDSNTISLNAEFKHSLTVYDFSLENENFIENKSVKYELIQFRDISQNIYSNYRYFYLKNGELTMHINNSYFISKSGYINKLFESVNFKIDDLNILYISSEPDYDDMQNSEQLQLSESEKLLIQLKRNLEEKNRLRILNNAFKCNKLTEYFSNTWKIPISLCINSDQNLIEQSNEGKDVYDFNNCNLHINMSTSKEKIKSIDYSICFIINKEELQEISNIDNILKQVKEYILLMISQIYELNTTTTNTYSLYIFEKENKIPYYVLYNRKEVYDILEDSLFSQRKYFMELYSLDLNINTMKPRLKMNQLNSNENYKLEQISKEWPLIKPMQSKYILIILVNKFIISPHSDIFHDIIEDGSLKCIEGNYIFYHAGINSFYNKNCDYQFIKNKAFIEGFRATQTILSWLEMNGYINFDAYNMKPFATEIKDKFSLIDISKVIMECIDCELELVNYSHNSKDLEFKIKLDLIESHILTYKSPIIIEKINKINGISYTSFIKTIFGINTESEFIGTLNHSYKKDNSLLSLKKYEGIQYCTLDKLFEVYENNTDFEVNLLFLKPPFTL